MKRRCKGKDINLSLLVKIIVLFLSSRNFQTFISRKDNIFTIVGRSPSWDVLVNVKGVPNDFTIELAAVGKPSDVALGSLMSFIGGVGLALRRLKSEEAVERIKNDFWGFIENELTIGISFLKNNKKWGN